MDRDQVIMAMGRPAAQIARNKEGVDYEDWIYGNPPRPRDLRAPSSALR